MTKKIKETNISLEQVMETYENEKRKQFNNIKNETLHQLESAESNAGVLGAASAYSAHTHIFALFTSYLSDHFGFDVVPEDSAP